MCYFKTGVTPRINPLTPELSALHDQQKITSDQSLKSYIRVAILDHWLFTVQHLEHCCMLHLLMLGTKGLKYFLKGF